MNDDTPNVEQDQTRDILERVQALSASQLEDLITSGGKKTIRHRCTKCGEVNTIDVPVYDPDTLVKALSGSSSALKSLQAAKDDVSGGATRLLHDRSELTDEELAEYIAKLEAELA